MTSYKFFGKIWTRKSWVNQRICCIHRCKSVWEELLLTIQKERFLAKRIEAFMFSWQCVPILGESTSSQLIWYFWGFINSHCYDFVLIKQTYDNLASSVTFWQVQNALVSKYDINFIWQFISHYKLKIEILACVWTWPI